MHVLRVFVRPFLLLLACLLLPVFSTAAAERLFYRHVDAHGNRVIEDRITESALIHGYTVTDRFGKVIKTVPPRPTEEELAARQAEREARVAEEKAAQQREAWDKYLLLRYSSVEDIAAAKERALNQIQVRIDILKSNVASLKQTVEREQRIAADRQRRTGKADNAEHRALIGAYNDEIIELEKQIAARERELEETTALYDRDIDRFNDVLAQGRLRGGRQAN